ncbi:large ribosomal subunit protein bL32m [Topomyia yanbarensis]|uniref:large ribosomal subunit protein bL32m n=1 Tax=Topomyia yanbarensis TaxID=2498891 RepID=UPI00273C526E|nr:large ribosomal subunit protein bL32m [Topomyia yanbarensis]
MSSGLLFRCRVALQRLEQFLPSLLGLPGRFPPPGSLALIGIEGSRRPIPTGDAGKPFSWKDLIGDGILWAAPKHRRTVEKRLKRKYGSPDYKLKILLPKKHLRICSTCGGDHEVGVLCPTCYKKIRQETELIQEKIQTQLGLDPVDKEVVVLYDRERDDQSEEYWMGKRIVEMEKSRPVWFGKNLLQRSTEEQQPAEVKPDVEKLG